MIDDLLRALIRSKNAAADEVLLDALRVGTPREQTVVLGALLARKSLAGLVGVVGLYPSLPTIVRDEVVANVGAFHPALREAGRSSVVAQRLGAIALIADGRQGRLAYVLSESLQGSTEEFAKAAAAALDTLARWISDAIRALQDGPIDLADAIARIDVAQLDANEVPVPPRAQWTDDVAAAALYRQIIDNRADVEAAIVRAFELHRGTTQQELLSAALRLCDHSQALALRVLASGRHLGQGVMIRRVQQSPDADHVPAFLLAATHGNLRGHFGVAFGKIESPDVLAALLRQTHWLKDARTQLCMRQVTQGAWVGGDASLMGDLSRRSPDNAARIGAWIASTGADEPTQDLRLNRVLATCGDDFGARLRLFRAIAARPRGSSVAPLRAFLRDPDERLARMAVRELMRRRPAEHESALLPLMTDAPTSVRRLVGRAVGQRGFESFWERFDRMDTATRRNAGRAMMKLLPDAISRLGRRLSSGNVEARVKALQITRELELVSTLKAQVLPLCAHPHPRVRSKAVTALGDIGAAAIDTLLERVAHDSDARVRANAIEVMEQRGTFTPTVIDADRTEAAAPGVRFVPLLTERARTGDNRERANAIKALHSMKVGVAAGQLLQMLRDPRPEHRISALWALRKIGWWRMLAEVARLAREDQSTKVRQYAVGVLQTASVEMPEVRMAG